MHSGTGQVEIQMRTMFLAAALTLALGGAGQAQSVDAGAVATSPTLAPHAHPRLAGLRRTPQNGVRRYEMHRNGLLKNGLLPLNGEQG